MTRGHAGAGPCLGDTDDPQSYAQLISLGDMGDPQKVSCGKSLGVIWDKSGGHLNKSGGHPCPPTVFTNHYQPTDIPGSRRNSPLRANARPASHRPRRRADRTTARAAHPGGSRPACVRLRSELARAATSYQRALPDFQGTAHA